ncbi:MAG: PAS domain-containing sensor histidine kinase [Candidatus Thorarchaeota archaeon]
MADNQEHGENGLLSELGCRNILKMANDGILAIQDGIIAYSNTAFCEMLSTSAKEIIGTAFEDYLDPPTRHMYMEKIESFNFGESSRPSFRVRLLDSKRHVVNAEMSTSDFILNGKPAILAIVRDISEQVTLEASLEASEARYRTLYDSSPIAYFTLSRRGIIQDVNSAAENLLGYASSDMLGRDISSLTTGKERGRRSASQIVSEVLQGKTVKDVEMNMLHSDGSAIWASVTASPLSVPDEPSRIGFMALDINRRKMAELKEKEERERANLYLDVITHDLSNVNQTLLFTIGLIEQSLDIPPEIQQLIRESNWNIDRATRMITNLRTIWELQKHPPQVEKNDPVECIHRALQSVRETFRWKQIDVTFEIGEGEFEIVGNRFLPNVFLNVLTNSVLFTEGDQVEIRIQGTREGDMVKIKVIDFGKGIPDAMKESIFKRNSSEQQMVGRGLGLTLARMVIKELGGSVWAEDRVPGDHTKGASIAMTLPQWVEDAELPCGRSKCIAFYESNHCLFCEPTKESLFGLLRETGIPDRFVEVVNVDDPNVVIDEDELPMLPMIRICEEELTGFVGEDRIRTSLMRLLTKECYPGAL